ncbi:MAG: flagellar motor switch protein FliM [Ilumatobacteraceae bacterium]|jgi:flagellar motor switch protein FliM
MDGGPASERKWEPCDLRRPTKLSREQLRSLDLFHDTLSRRLSSGVSRLARASAAVEIVRTTQLSWEEYLRTLPAVTTLVTVAAPPLPGDILIEMDTALSLALASRLLGGSGRVEPPRRPGELELPALQRIAGVTVEALGDAINQFLDVRAHLEAVDLSPQLLGLASPSQVVLVLTYSLSVPSCSMSGDVAVVMSLSTLTPMLDKLMSHAAERAGADLDPTAMRGVTERVPIELQATLSTTVMSAGHVAALTPGDVIVLDHRSGQPALISIGEIPILKGHLGRRGSRLAIAVSEHPFADPAARSAQSPLLQGPVAPGGPSTATGQHGYAEMAHDATTHDSERQHDARDSDTRTSAVHSLR